VSLKRLESNSLARIWSSSYQKRRSLSSLNFKIVSYLQRWSQSDEYCINNSGTPMLCRSVGPVTSRRYSNDKATFVPYLSPTFSYNLYLSDRIFREIHIQLRSWSSLRPRFWRDCSKISVLSSKIVLSKNLYSEIASLEDRISVPQGSLCGQDFPLTSPPPKSTRQPQLLQ